MSSSVTLHAEELYLLEDTHNMRFRLYVVTKSLAGRLHILHWWEIARKMYRDGSKNRHASGIPNRFEIKVGLHFLWNIGLLDLQADGKDKIDISFPHDDSWPWLFVRGLGTAWIERGKEYPVQRDPVSKKLREQVFERDGYACIQCGRRHQLTADHIRPLIAGGETTLKNLQTLCRSCNSRKGGRFSEL